MSPTESQEQSVLSRFFLHPFAFALYPVLSLFAGNLGQTYPEMFLVAAVLVASAVALTLFGLTRLLRQRPLAALLTSWLVLGFFLYGVFTIHIQEVKFGDFVFLRNMHRIPLYAGLFLLLGFGLFKVYQRWGGLTKFLNVSSLCLLVAALLSLGWHWMFGAGGYSPTLTASEKGNSPAAAANDSRPDIYYIILDGYGSAEVLAKYFGYTNSQFISFLRDKGFYLPAQARSNYGMTALSLGSSLNMEYLRTPTLQIHENKVRQYVETNGYRYIGFSSMNPPLRSKGRGGFAWRALLQNEFTLQLLRTTVLDPVALRLNLYAYPVRHNLLSCFELLQELPEQPGNKFVFAHLLCPHPPYVFKADGSSPAISLSEANLSLYRTPWDDKEAYVQQVQFLNGKVLEVLEALLQKSKVPPVIVVQGDHGPKLTTPDRATAVDMHMGILNAYFLPGAGRAALYDTITPVNSFRVIFNQYLHGRLPVLEDRCYFSTSEMPFAFTDVTAQTIR